MAGGIRVQTIANWCFERKAVSIRVLLRADFFGV